MAAVSKLKFGIMPTSVLPLILCVGCISNKNSMPTNFIPLKPAITASVDGIDINYTENVTSNASPTIVLIHGFGASLETWNDLYPLLCSNYSVVRMDLKGSGFSSKPKDGKYAPADQAHLLIRFLNEIGQTNVVLVGYSLGGGVALLTYFDTLLPTRKINVKGLVLFDSAGYLQKLPFFVESVRNPFTRMISYLMSPYSRAEFVLKRIMKVQNRITPDRIHRYSYFLDLPGSRYALLQTAKQIVPRNISEFSRKFHSITAPTLILWGADDPVIPVENAYRFNKDIPNSQLVVLPETGHIPHEERPTETFRAVDQFMRTLK